MKRLFVAFWRFIKCGFKMLTFRRLKKSGLFRTLHFWYIDFEFTWFFTMYFFGLFEPPGFITHEHFTMFYLGSMYSKITAPLNKYFRPIFSIVHAGFKTLHWRTSFRGVYS